MRTVTKTRAKKRSMPTRIDFRKVILARLKEIERTRNWLAERQTVVSHGSAREFLYGYGRTEGGRDPKGKTIAELLRILGLELKPVRGYKPEVFDSSGVGHGPSKPKIRVRVPS